jgi:hypothetical protein
MESHRDITLLHLTSSSRLAELVGHHPAVETIYYGHHPGSDVRAGGRICISRCNAHLRGSRTRCGPIVCSLHARGNGDLSALRAHAEMEPGQVILTDGYELQDAMTAFEVRRSLPQASVLSSHRILIMLRSASRAWTVACCCSKTRSLRSTPTHRSSRRKSAGPSTGPSRAR